MKNLILHYFCKLCNTTFNIYMNIYMNTIKNAFIMTRSIIILNTTKCRMIPQAQF